MHTTRRWDGRWLAAVCVALCLALLGARHAVPTVAHLWVVLGVSMPDAPFVDTRNVIAGAESLRDGLDPILRNPHAPHGVRANYPHLWFYPLMWLGLHQDATPILGALVVLAFYVGALAFAGPLPPGDGLVWAFFLCGAPVCRGVVLANNDLVIFALLALALCLRRRSAPATAGAAGLGYGIIGLCAALKLFPVVGFCLALRARPRAAAAVLGAALAGFAAYAYAIRAQIAAIARTIPESSFDMYGRKVAFGWLHAAHPGLLPPGPASALLAVMVAALAAFAWMRAPRLVESSEWKGDALMTGAALYVATFFLSTNGNYRLIFLLFTLPALLEMLRAPDAFPRLWAGAGLGLLGIAWVFSGQTYLYLVLLKELANWALFALMAFLWLQCLPATGWPRRAGV